MVTRREILLRSAQAFAFAALGGRTLTLSAGRPGTGPAILTDEDQELLQAIEEAAFRFFWEAASPYTGLVKDRSYADGTDDRPVASIAATGFGLTALAIGDRRRFRSSEKIRERVRKTLKFLWERFPQHKGFFFHFVDMHSGERVWNSELSSVDTTLLLLGALTCGRHFEDAEIKELAVKLFLRADWQWMLNGGRLLSHGWRPESGFIEYRWDNYCELMMIYLLALGSPSFPIPGESWEAWERTWFDYEGLHYIESRAPLFVHQYSHAWFDFRGKRDRHTNYFQNSILATRAHKIFCQKLKDEYPWFGENLWGITASDSQKGYVVWGGPPKAGPIDGTLVPCAPAGSIPFLPRECLDVLHRMKRDYGKKVWKRYGFVDAFHPGDKWFDRDVIGIDVGITMLMAENARSGFVWDTFMSSEVAQRGMERAGFRAEEKLPAGPKPS